jgi:hypothetical protein
MMLGAIQPNQTFNTESISHSPKPTQKKTKILPFSILRECSDSQHTYL